MSNGSHGIADQHGTDTAQPDVHNQVASEGDGTAEPIEQNQIDSDSEGKLYSC